MGAIDLARRPPHVVAGLGVARTFQTLRLYRNLTAIENVLAGMHLRRRDDTLRQLIPVAPLLNEDRHRLQQARELLARVGLPPDSFGDRGPPPCRTATSGGSKSRERSRSILIC